MSLLARPASATYHQVVATVNTGSGSKGVAITPDGSLAYVTLGDGSTVLVFRIRQGGSSPHDVTASTGYGADLALVDSLTVGQNPNGIAMDPLGTFALVANEGAGTVSVVALPRPATVPMRFDLDLALLFDRDSLDAFVAPGDSVRVDCAGLIGAREFTGAALLRSVRRTPISEPAAGSMVGPGNKAVVRYTPQLPPGSSTVSLLQSLDGGQTWVIVATGAPNTGELTWTVPMQITTAARVAIVESDSAYADSTVHGVAGSTERFSIDASVETLPGGEPHPTFTFAFAPITPAPARREARLRFSLPQRGRVRLELSDVQGRLVRPLLDEEREPGWSEVAWNGSDANGRHLGAGLYYARLTTLGFHAIHSFVFLR